MSNTLFVLGAADPEMAEIEKLLDGANVRYQYATVNGSRVHAGNAYNADPPPLDNGLEDWQEGYESWLVAYVKCGSVGECGEHMDNLPEYPGFCKSSIGQVIEWISCYSDSELPEEWDIGAVEWEGNLHEIEPSHPFMLQGRHIIYTRPGGYHPATYSVIPMALEECIKTRK